MEDMRGHWAVGQLGRDGFVEGRDEFENPDENLRLGMVGQA